MSRPNCSTVVQVHTVRASSAARVSDPSAGRSPSAPAISASASSSWRMSSSNGRRREGSRFDSLSRMLIYRDTLYEDGHHMQAPESSCIKVQMTAWLYRYWVAASLIMGIFLLLLLPVLLFSWELPILLIYLQMPVYMLHQVEEHTGDRFRAFVNQA